MRGEVVRCQAKSCKGKKDALIKPDIVFFGEGLPDKFFERMSDFQQCDLLLVLGTSLSVGPFNSLLHRVPPTCPRVLINLELVGEAEHAWEEGFKFVKDDDSRDEQGSRDLFWKGESDHGVEELCRLVGQGWDKDLEKLREEGWRALSPEGARQKETDVKTPSNASEVAGEIGKGIEEKGEKDQDVDELAQAVEGVKITERASEQPDGAKADLAS